MIKELIEKYSLKANSYYNKSVCPYKDTSQEERDAEDSRMYDLQNKYKEHIPSGWYGFMGLGSPTPPVWYDVLEELFDHLVKEYPELEILQIKLKFGFLRIYINNIPEDIQKEIYELETVLCDEKLIY